MWEVMSEQMWEANVSGYVRAGNNVMKILMAMILALLVGCDGEAYKEWSAELNKQTLVDLRSRGSLLDRSFNA